MLVTFAKDQNPRGRSRSRSRERSRDRSRDRYSRDGREFIKHEFILLILFSTFNYINQTYFLSSPRL